MEQPLIRTKIMIAADHVVFDGFELNATGVSQPILTVKGSNVTVSNLYVHGNNTGFNGAASILFDGRGEFVETEMEERLVSIPLETLKKIPRKVALAGGEGKADAIRGALRTGMIDVLVTDEGTGREVAGM